ncbi:MAG TPA: hypothetical protein VHZ51_27105, partial [Ktedonobacteraceae bacterium]|nr:hypothetical protein [Ktedonobacteraceae bacterium]
AIQHRTNSNYRGTLAPFDHVHPTELDGPCLRVGRGIQTVIRGHAIGIGASFGVGRRKQVSNLEHEHHSFDFSIPARYTVFIFIVR